MSLTRYRAKRDFTKTAEPSGRAAKASTSARAAANAKPRGRAHAAKQKSGLRFVIQKHAASRLHYDFRLELDGTLKSWAVPKGPSVDPADKRLAVHVEDHPIEYGGFEGVIPEKQYGAGEVIVWDRGTWAPLSGDARRDYREGHLKFHMEGEKMHGDWALVRMHGGRFGGDEKHDNWLLIKERDDAAMPGKGEILVREHPESVISGREVEELKGNARVDTWDSNESDPKKAFKPASGKKAAVKKAAAKVPGKKAATKTAARKPTAKAPAKKAVTKQAAGQKTTRGKSRDDTEPASAALDDVGRKAALPATLDPQLATLLESPPEGEGWVYEIKLDGYRLLARVEKGRARLITRNGHDWSDKFPAIIAALEALAIGSAWLDGEVCVMNDAGVSSFGLLQQWLSNEGEGAKREAVYMVFDLAYCAGRDLRALPLMQRKELLAALLARAPEDGVLRLSGHLDADGGAAQAQACKLGLEGLIGKRLDGPYVNGRSRDWIKLKCRQRQEFVVVGYTPPQGSRSGFGSLLLGVHEKGKLRYAGRVGTGFDANALSDMLARMQALATEKSPFDTALPAAARVRGTQWIKPKLVAEITFAEWTGDGIVRQAAFEGLRADKPAKNIAAELPADAPQSRKKKSTRGAAGLKAIKDEAAAPPATRASATRASANRSPRMSTAAPRVARSSNARPVKAAAKATLKAATKAAAKSATKAMAKTTKAAAKPAPKSSARAVAKPAAVSAKSAVKLAGGHDSVAGITISHADRVVYPDDGITKGEVAQFCEQVASRMLPYIKDRPLSLVRCPGGIGAACFFQKHATDMKVEGISQPQIRDTHGDNPYIVVENAAGLVGLAQWGNIELHAWGATMADIEHPDMIVLDFDPADDVPWKEIAAAARAARTLFEALGLTSFLKTTGGKGLHVVVPFKPGYDWETVKEFAHHAALRMVEAFPDRFLATATKAKRAGKIFIDYLRNGRGATAAVPFTLRARPGAPVALPLSWDDMKRDWRARPATLKDVMGARGKQRDPWADYFKVQKKQALTDKMLRGIGMK
ncbi:MAG TPA: non-homologous end-joining DNA ligase [Burkholderiales bacterium]